MQHRIGHDANNLWHVCRVVRRHQEERHQCGDYGVHSQAPLKPCRRLNTFEQCGRAGPQHHDAQHETGLEREIHPELRFGPCLICAHEAETGDRKAPQRHDESHASSLPLRQWAVWCGWRIGHSADEYDDTEPGNIESGDTRIRRALPARLCPDYT